MMLARVYVTDVSGNRLSLPRASMRHAAKLLTFYSVLGSFMPLWTKRRQTLHDFMVGSVVLNRNSAAGNEAQTVAVQNTNDLVAVSEPLDSNR
jgi:hypothetical protein